MKAVRTHPVTPLMRIALRNFRRARTAIVRGRVDEMIDCLTRGMGCLEVIEGASGPRR